MPTTVHRNNHQRISLRPVLTVLVIVLLGFFLRTLHVNWDENQHLHPDERFLTMVMGAMKLPSTFSDYLSPDRSSFNPANVGFKFYVYGIFPLALNKTLAQYLGLDDYNSLTILGRYFSAVMDTLLVLLVILITRLLEKKYEFSKNVKYITGLFYAISTLPIQQSHFFTVDTFAGTFFFLSFFWALKVHQKNAFASGLVSGLLMGMAVACKVNLLLGGPLVGWFVIEPFIMTVLFQKKFKLLIHSCAVTILWFLGFWVMLRIAAPYYFDHFSLVDWHLSSLFLSNIHSLQAFADPNGFFPPSIQWIGKTPFLFPLINFAAWGIGFPLFFFAVYGWGRIALFALKRKKERFGILVIIFWMLGFFAYQGFQFVITMRYFLLLYPFAALGAAYGVQEFGYRLNKRVSFHAFQPQIVVIVCVISCFIWPMMFLSVYLHRHTRLEASFWMYKNLPDKSRVALEHWDDPLPLDADGMNIQRKAISGTQLPVFYEDNDVKWHEINRILGEADYYVLTSNRGWGSIIILPQKYPKMSQFYLDLFDGNTEFEKIAEFTSYPSLDYLGIPLTINDDWAEEAFTVYDHPKVMIFAKKK